MVKENLIDRRFAFAVNNYKGEFVGFIRAYNRKRAKLKLNCINTGYRITGWGFSYLTGPKVSSKQGVNMQIITEKRK